jgi:O-antigen/teichoic acid export membrane protein
VVVARSLGPTGYGRYALMFTLYRTLYSFVIVGVGAGTTVLYSEAWANKNYDECPKILAYFMKVYLVAHGLAGIFGWLLSIWFATHLYKDAAIGYIARWLFLEGVILICFEITIAVMQATGMMKSLAILLTINAIFNSILISVSAWYVGDLYSIMIGYLTASILASLIGAVYYLQLSKRNPSRFPPLSTVMAEIKKVGIRKRIGVGFKIKLSKVIPSWIALVPINILGYYAPADSVGFFRLASTISRMPEFLWNSISKSLVYKYYETIARKGRKGLLKIHHKLAIFSGCLSIAIYGIYYFILPVFIDILYGSKFHDVTYLAKILILPLLLSGFVIGVNQLMIMIDRQNTLIGIVTLPFLLLLPLGWYLIINWHAVGVAVFLSLVELITIGLKIYMTSKRLRNEILSPPTAPFVRTNIGSM